MTSLLPTAHQMYALPLPTFPFPQNLACYFVNFLFGYLKWTPSQNLAFS